MEQESKPKVKKTTNYFPWDVAEALRLFAFEQRCSQNEIVVAAVIEYLEKRRSS